MKTVATTTIFKGECLNSLHNSITMLITTTPNVANAKKL